MHSFSDQIKFKFPWRKYQQRVLDALDTHLEYDHLHVIAPPGSGKTVLGLEVMLRIGQPTLILAPTLAIRNQWIQRFCDLFLQQAEIPDWISKDIRNPKQITVVTYQGLHSACNDTKASKLDFEDETDVKAKAKSNFLFLKDIVRKLKKCEVNTFILDESHHLKNEWWQTLSRLKKEMNPKVVGLTATPPYDVTPLEWHRYIELNGAIDVEISVPELMAEGDLCPHQDFVYYSSVSEDELRQVVKLRKRMRLLYEELKSSSTLIEAVQHHPMIVNPMGQEYYIFENLDFYAACLIFLQENTISLSPLHWQILGLLDGKDNSQGDSLTAKMLQLPSLAEKWLEKILHYALFEDQGYFLQNFKKERELLLDRLRHAGVVERKSVRFLHNPTIDKKISSSITKLYAIGEIVQKEYSQLRHELRQVILTDYVRKEYLGADKENVIALKQIGVLSIFEYLRRNNTQNIKLGILTGTLVIIPLAAYAPLYIAMESIGASDIKFVPLPYDGQYLRCNVDDKNRDQMVYLITLLLQQGYIEVLTGTKALLGEGWDAPSINSLILASVVGAFVSSNQMRGRAIRTTSLDMTKTSNIWHIACVDPSILGGGADVDLMERRFRNFVGISEDDDIRIQNGIARLALYENNIDADNISSYNTLTLARAQRRDTLKDRWEMALPLGTELVEEIKIPYFEPNEYQGMKTAQMQKSIANMAGALASSAMFFAEMSAKVFSAIGKSLGVNGQAALLGFLGVGTVFFAGRSITTYRYYMRYRDISKDIYQIGNTLVQTLCKNGIFTSPIHELNVLTFSDSEGYVYCHLDKGTTYEKSTFVQLIQEIVDPIYDPRYIIVRKSKLLKVVRQLDYHAVPEIIAKKAALAKDFLHFWKLNVGEADLIFTKSIKGYQFLIRSRINALANHMESNKEVEHINTWR